MDGWRVFRVNRENRRLYPLDRILLWERHPSDYDDYLVEPAVCDGYGFHHTRGDKNVPVETCRCGYHALFEKQQADALMDNLSFNDDLERFDRQSEHVSVQGGIVAHVRARDKTVVHEQGWRSRYMEVLALYWPRCEHCHSLLTLIKYRGDVDWYTVWNNGLTCSHSKRASDFFILATLSETKEILQEIAARYGAQLIVSDRGASLTSIRLDPYATTLGEVMVPL